MMNPRELFEQAYEAGVAAMNNCQPTPMTVVDRMSGQKWHVSEGACGFAWVKIKPARGAFVNWLKANDIGHRGYPTGYDYWVSEGGQSIERKTAFARAFAGVLRNAGLNAHAESRMD